MGCSDQNGASSGKPGSGTPPQGIRLPEQSHFGATLDSVQICSSVKVTSVGSLQSSSTVGQASSLAQRSIPEARKCARYGSFGGSPRAPGFGPVPRKKPGWAMLKPVKTEVSVDLSWKGPCPFSPPTSSPQETGAPPTPGSVEGVAFLP